MSKANRSILRCPSCGQQLRVPTDRGKLILTCPVCRHWWHWDAPKLDSNSADSRREMFYRKLIQALVGSDFRLRAEDLSEEALIADQDLNSAKKLVNRVVSTLAPYIVRASTGVEPPKWIVDGVVEGMVEEMLDPRMFELPPVFNLETVQQRLSKIREWAALVCFKYILAQPLIVAVVEADQLAHEKSINLASRFDQAVLEMLDCTGKWGGWGGTRLSSMGIILFTFFDHALASSFIEKTQKRCKIGHFWKKTWILPWIIDVPAKEIRPHSGLPVYIGLGLDPNQLVADVFGA